MHRFLITALPIFGGLAAATNIGTHNNFCFDASVNNNNLYNGAPLQEWQCASSWNQQWDIGNYALCIAGTNKCVDVKDGDGYHTQIWDRTGGPNQRFSYRDDGMFEWGNTGLCLAVPDYNYNNGVPIVLDKCSKHSDNMIVSYGGAIGYSAAMAQQQKSSGSSRPASPQQQQQQQSGSSPFALFPNGNKRLLAWGVDNRFASQMKSGAKVTGYYHWADGPVSQMPQNYFYALQYWGTSKRNDWYARLGELGNSLPKMVLGFNEPDISGQASMDPQSAANEYRNEIHNRFANKGVVLVSPACAWDYQDPNGWMARFMNACQGCQIDAVAIHAYLDLNNNVNAAVQELKKRVETAYNNWRKPIMVTELGLTSQGGGNEGQVKQFLQAAAAYLDGNPNVAGWAFSGCYAQNGAWDGYMLGTTYFYLSNGALSDLGYTYLYG